MTPPTPPTLPVRVSPALPRLPVPPAPPGGSPRPVSPVPPASPAGPPVLRLSRHPVSPGPPRPAQLHLGAGHNGPVIPPQLQLRRQRGTRLVMYGMASTWCAPTHQVVCILFKQRPNPNHHHSVALWASRYRSAAGLRAAHQATHSPPGALFLAWATTQRRAPYISTADGTGERLGPRLDRQFPRLRRFPPLSRLFRSSSPPLPPRALWV